MKASEEDDFYCPLCGCNLLWMPVSHIFVCEHCKESFSESAKYYLRKKDVTKGNQQKMREALVAIRKALLVDSGMGPHTAFHNEVDRLTAEALSAPPRNCDKMPDIDNLTMHDLAKSPCKSTLECASREELLALVRWLLAPAAAQEGGAE